MLPQLRFVPLFLAVLLVDILNAGIEQALAQGAPPAPPVTVSKPLAKEIVEWQEFTGQFAAVEFVEIRARVSGYLTEILFTDGQMVKKGDPLFVIDPRPFEADLQLAEANLERDQAQLNRANLDLKRYAELSRSSFASQQQYETTRAAAEGAAATVKGDRAAVAQASSTWNSPASWRRSAAASATTRSAWATW